MGMCTLDRPENIQSWEELLPCGWEFVSSCSTTEQTAMLCLNLQGTSKESFPRFCEYVVKQLRLFTYCRQKNAIDSHHIHRNWEGFFRGFLYYKVTNSRVFSSPWFIHKIYLAMYKTIVGMSRGKSFMNLIFQFGSPLPSQPSPTDRSQQAGAIKILRSCPQRK